MVSHDNCKNRKSSKGSKHSKSSKSKGKHKSDLSSTISSEFTISTDNPGSTVPSHSRSSHTYGNRSGVDSLWEADVDLEKRPSRPKSRRSHDYASMESEIAPRILKEWNKRSHNDYTDSPTGRSCSSSGSTRLHGTSYVRECDQRSSSRRSHNSTPVLICPRCHLPRY